MHPSVQTVIHPSIWSVSLSALCVGRAGRVVTAAELCNWVEVLGRLETICFLFSFSLSLAFFMSVFSSFHLPPSLLSASFFALFIKWVCRELWQARDLFTQVQHVVYLFDNFLFYPYHWICTTINVLQVLYFLIPCLNLYKKSLLMLKFEVSSRLHTTTTMRFHCSVLVITVMILFWMFNGHYFDTLRIWVDIEWSVFNSRSYIYCWTFSSLMLFKICPSTVYLRLYSVFSCKTRFN